MFLWLCFWGIIIALTCACVFICVRTRSIRKREYRNMSKLSEVKLPDRENSYLRSRLSGALSCEDVEKIPKDTCLFSVAKLLKKLTEKQLSGADVLMVRKLQRLIAEHAEKSKVSPYEKERLPYAVTSVLSLCAKYGIDED